jgi:peptidoglycan/LPS O-acetylase OafA/YrhL
MSEAPKRIRTMKVIVGLIALGWAALMVALYLGVSTSSDWTSDTATVWAMFAGTAALIGAVFTFLQKKWAVWLYLAATVAVGITPYMQGSIGRSVVFDWGYLVLLLIYIAAVVPAWKHMGTGNA